MANRIESAGEIVIDVLDGCIDCPFAGGEPSSKCQAVENDLRQTHDYTFPSGCPLLDKNIIKVGFKIKDE
jgi:hypothetical protein